MIARIATVVVSLWIASPSTPVLRAQASTVIFVRHAEKAATPTAADPDLSDVGRARVGELVAALAHFHLDAVYVTEYRRTRQTGDSIALAQHLVPMVVATKGDAKVYAAALALELRRLPPGSSALVVGHSNTVGPVITALGGPRVPDLCDGEYATLYLLELAGDKLPPRLLRAIYGPPDTAEGVACSHKMRLP